MVSLSLSQQSYVDVNKPVASLHFTCAVFSGSAVCVDTNDDPLEVLKVQLQEFTQLVVEGNDGGTVHTHTHTCTHTQQY